MNFLLPFVVKLLNLVFISRVSTFKILHDNSGLIFSKLDKDYMLFILLVTVTQKMKILYDEKRMIMVLLTFG